MNVFMLCGIVFPFLMTAAGAAVVYLFRGGIGARAQRICLGFAAGVMAAATAFSLLVPAQRMMDGGAAWLWLSSAFMVGAAAVMLLDVLVRRAGYALRRGQDAQRRITFLTAIVLHNIPEGMAVGLAFASAAVSPAAAAAVALGIGLQNLPEGAAVSLPLRHGGMSRRRAFLLGTLSGAVEPLAALLMIAFSAWLAPVLPALMAFSAGAMMLVVLAELSPASAAARDGALAAMIGFALMMAMDIGLG
ncbi:MAG: ZIP family metal transporter [Clostridia bacterium]|nr:ZIP family metal transporter [Clostridia bacterium]